MKEFKIFYFFYFCRTGSSSAGVFKRFVLVLRESDKKSSPKILNYLKETKKIQNGLNWNDKHIEQCEDGDA